MRGRRSFSLICLIILWATVSYTKVIDPLFLPTPTAVIAATVTLFRSHLGQDIATSLYRVFCGFGLAALLSVPFGIYLAVSRPAEEFFGSTLSFIRYIPPSALVPISILWFGIGDWQKILFIFLGVAPYLTVLVFDVVTESKQEYVEVAYTLGANRFQVITQVIIPQALPGIWNALRLMMGAAWTFVVFAEIITATSGLGYIIMMAGRFVQTANLIAAVVIIGILGLITDWLFKCGYVKLFPWTEKLPYVGD